MSVLTIYGLLKLFRSLRRYGGRHDFAVQFMEKLRVYWESAGRDSEAYSWLIHRSNKMQGELGGQGVIHNYKPPYQNYMIRSYPIILNMLPDLRRSLEDDILSRSLSREYMNALQESLIRYLGSLEDAQDGVRRELRNPVVWFREGVRDLIALPAYLIAWLGLISGSTARKWTSSILFTVLSGLVALVGFVSALFTIVIGWTEFTDAVRKLLS